MVIFCQLIVVLRVEAAARLRAAGVEGIQHQNCRRGAVGNLIVLDVEVLEARLVHRSRPQHRGVRDLDGVVLVESVVAARRQVEAADALVLHVVARESVADYQSIVLAQLIIHARADAQAPLRSQQHAGIGSDRVRLRIERNRVDDRAVVDFAPLGIEDERGALAERAR